MKTHQNLWDTAIVYLTSKFLFFRLELQILKCHKRKSLNIFKTLIRNQVPNQQKARNSKIRIRAEINEMEIYFF